MPQPLRAPPPNSLSEVLVRAREKKGWSLREVERRTQIHNAHLSQIETGTIERPDPNILWVLADVYGLEYLELLELAGHTERGSTGARRSLMGAALHALGDLEPEEQQEVLRFMDTLRSRKNGSAK